METKMNQDAAPDKPNLSQKFLASTYTPLTEYFPYGSPTKLQCFGDLCCFNLLNITIHQLFLTKKHHSTNDALSTIEIRLPDPPFVVFDSAAVKRGILQQPMRGATL